MAEAAPHGTDRGEFRQLVYYSPNTVVSAADDPVRPWLDRDLVTLFGAAGLSIGRHSDNGPIPIVPEAVAALRRHRPDQWS